MKLAHPVLALALATAAAVGQKAVAPPEVGLVVNLAPAQVNFTVVAQESPFVGIVLVSLSPNLAHYLVDLPPLLADGVVAAWGYTPGLRYGVSFRDVVFPPGIEIYAQGVALFESRVAASGVSSFVLDVTGEG
jgi:hypothetical protein